MLKNAPEGPVRGPQGHFQDPVNPAPISTWHRFNNEYQNLVFWAV
jgi:hypothetical protein